MLVRLQSAGNGHKAASAKAMGVQARRARPCGVKAAGASILVARRSGLNERLADCNQRQFGLIADAQLLFDVVEVRADG